MAVGERISDECRYCGKICRGQGICNTCKGKLEAVRKFIRAAKVLKEELERCELSVRRGTAEETVAKYGHEAIFLTRATRRRR